MSVYKKVKSGMGVADVNPLQAVPKPTIDFSAGRNNTPEQTSEIQSAMGEPAYIPPAEGGAEKGETKAASKPFTQSKNSKRAEALIKGNMRRTWGGTTPGSSTPAQAERTRRDAEYAARLKRESMWK